MSQPPAAVAADTSEEKDDEEIVALLPPAADNGKDETNVGSLRRTPGPHAMRRTVSFKLFCLSICRFPLNLTGPRPFLPQDEEYQRRTPLVSNSRRGGKTPSQPQQLQRQLYTPAHFTLSKNPHLQMEGGRPGVFSPNTIRMTDSLDKLLRDDDEEESDAPLVGDVTATPQPVKFDGNRGGGAFEPPKSSAMKRLHRPGAEVPSTGEGSLHTPKPQRAGGARYGREEAMPMHHQHHLPPPHMNGYDPYQGNHPPMQHDPYFAPLAEDSHMYLDMHQFGPIPPTVVSPLTIPEYPPYPMHAASWSPIPPEFGGNLPPGRDHWNHHPPPHGVEFHPHGTGYDHHYQHMHMPHHNQHSHYHLPGNVSPFMPHYNHHMMAHAPPYQPTSAPLSPPRNEIEKQHVRTAETSPKSHGRPRKDSCASVNSISSKSVGDTISPNYSRNLNSNSSEEEMNWFVPHAVSGEIVARGTSQQYPQQFGPSGPPGRSNSGYNQSEKKQVKKQAKKPSLKQAKDTKQTHSMYTNKVVNQKSIRSGPAAANPAQEFLESPAERAAFKVCELVYAMLSIQRAKFTDLIRLIKGIWSPIPPKRIIRCCQGLCASLPKQNEHRYLSSPVYPLACILRAGGCSQAMQ